MIHSTFWRILGVLAMVASMLVFSACGGGSSAHSRQITHLPIPPSNGPRYVNAVFAPIAPGDQHFQAFDTYLMTQPNVTGVTLIMPWSAIETSQGNYDFTAYDNGLAQFIQAGKHVNLIVAPALEGAPNTYTPSYVLTAGYAAQVGAPNPQDMAVCMNYPGDSSNPFYTDAQNGGGGSWNASTSSDTTGLPVSYELPFQTAYKAFITAVIQHYNNNATTPIGYIRFGMTQGGEASPLCNQYWPGYSKTTYLNYVQGMTQYIAAQNPTMLMLADLHAVGPPGNVDYDYADQEAAFAVQNNSGFGTNGLQESDIVNFGNGSPLAPCDSDWCALFLKYNSKTIDGKPIRLSLQTIGATNPSNPQQTGSLDQLLPLAKALGTNNLELYVCDLLIAYDPNYPSSGCVNNASPAVSGAYSSAIESFLAP